jgi:hypothetical protein
MKNRALVNLSETSRQAVSNALSGKSRETISDTNVSSANLTPRTNVPRTPGALRSHWVVSAWIALLIGRSWRASAGQSLASRFHQDATFVGDNHHGTHPTTLDLQPVKFAQG